MKTIICEYLYIQNNIRHTFQYISTDMQIANLVHKSVTSTSCFHFLLFYCYKKSDNKLAIFKSAVRVHTFR